MKYILFLMLAFANSSCDKDLFGAGSYLEAEEYMINATLEQLKSAIDTFRTENPEYYPPMSADSTQFLEYTDKTGRTHYFFNFCDKKRCVNTWIRYINSETIFALVSISRENYQYPYLRVNDNLEGSENEAVKREFEERILNPIKEILARGK